MPFDAHTVEQIDGSNFACLDRIKMGSKIGLTNNGSGGSISSVTVTPPGSYATMPTLVTTGEGSGASLSPRMGALSATLSSAGSGYAPGDTITLTGGTASTNSILTITNTKLISLSLNAAGTGYAVGDTIVLSGGTATTPAVLTVATITTGGAIATFTITTAGVYTANSTSFTQGSTSGSGTGATFNTASFAPNAVTPTTAGSYSVLPSNPVAQGSTSGSGTGATFTLLWKLVSVTVSAGGTGYDAASRLATTGGGSTGGAAGTFSLTNQMGNNAVIPVVFADSADLPENYAVFVNPGQPCLWYVPESSKTNTSFDVVLVPTGGVSTYGEMFISANATATSLTGVLWTKVAAGTSFAGYTAGDLKGFTFASGALTSTNTNTVECYVSVDLTAILGSGSTTKQFDFVIARNTNIISKTVNSISLPNGEHLAISFQGLIPIAPSDYIEIFVRNTAGTGESVIVSSADISIVPSSSIIASGSTIDVIVIG